MKQHHDFKAKCWGFIGKDGHTYLLSKQTRDGRTRLRIKETGKFVWISFDQWYLYECKNLLKKF
jgi:hypothetical protein